MIRAFGENHAVLLSTHILPEVTLICQRVAIINQGRLLAIDSPERLAKSLGTSQQRASGGHRAGRASARRPACYRRCPRRHRAPDAGQRRAYKPSNVRWMPRKASRRASRVRWPAAGICTGWNASNRRSRTFSCVTWATRPKRRPHERHACHLPQGSADVLPLSDRLLRGVGVPARHRLLLSLQHLHDRRRHDGRDVPEHGDPAADADPGHHDAPVLRRIHRTHHGAADDSAAQALADRARQIPRARRRFSC